MKWKWKTDCSASMPLAFNTLVLMLFAEYEEKKSVVANDAAAVGEASPAQTDAANANVVPLAAKVAAS